MVWSNSPLFLLHQKKLNSILDRQKLPQIKFVSKAIIIIWKTERKWRQIVVKIFPHNKIRIPLLPPTVNNCQHPLVFIERLTLQIGDHRLGNKQIMKSMLWDFFSETLFQNTHAKRKSLFDGKIIMVSNLVWFGGWEWVLILHVFNR